MVCAIQVAFFHCFTADHCREGLAWAVDGNSILVPGLRPMRHITFVTVKFNRYLDHGKLTDPTCLFSVQISWL